MSSRSTKRWLMDLQMLSNSFWRRKTQPWRPMIRTETLPFTLPFDADAWLAAFVRLRDHDQSIPASHVHQDRALVLADGAAAAQLGTNQKLEAQK